MNKQTSTSFSVAFQFERATPGAVRYQEIDSNGNVMEQGKGAKIGTIYIRKTALPTEIPAAILVSISIVK